MTVRYTACRQTEGASNAVLRVPELRLVGVERRRCSPRRLPGLLRDASSRRVAACGRAASAAAEARAADAAGSGPPRAIRRAPRAHEGPAGAGRGALPGLRAA